MLFFIILYLMLFYDNSAVGILSRGYPCKNTAGSDCTYLFFIILFLLLFYDNDSISDRNREQILSNFLNNLDGNYNKLC